METGKFKWDLDTPFACAKWETQKANRALKDYVAMGPGRSLAKLCQRYAEDILKEEKEQPPTRWLPTLKNWSSRYDWQARLARWDELEREGEEETWRTRRRQIRQGEWEQAKALTARAERMLKFPLEQVEKVEKVYKDGRAKEVVIVKPVRWSQRDVAQFMKVASELGRLAAEMEQRRQAVDVTSGGEPLRVVYIDDWRDSWRNDQAPQAASGPADSDARSGQVQVVGSGAAVAQDDDGNEHSD